MVRTKSARSEPLSTRSKQLSEDGEAGIGRSRALTIEPLANDDNNDDDDV